MGYLDELKQQAAGMRAQERADVGVLERNCELTEGVCHKARRYFTTLAQQLNVLQPFSKAVLRIDTQNEFRHLQMTDFKVDSRLKKLRFVEVSDFVAVSFAMKTGRSVTVARDFPPTVEKLEAKLTASGAPYVSEIVRDAETGKYVETRFNVRADFRGSARLVPDHDSAWVTFFVTNVDALGTTRVSFPAIEAGSARLDDLARWITGEPNGFLDGGTNLRTTEL